MSLQHLLFEYLEKHNFLKIVDVNSIFADVKSICTTFALALDKRTGEHGYEMVKYHRTICTNIIKRH